MPEASQAKICIFNELQQIRRSLAEPFKMATHLNRVIALIKVLESIQRNEFFGAHQTFPPEFKKYAKQLKQEKIHRKLTYELTLKLIDWLKHVKRSIDCPRTHPRTHPCL